MSKRTDVSRRHFLKAASTAAFAAPLILPSHLWAAEGEAKANDKIVFGYIGTGTQGRHLLNSFLPHPSVQVVAVCDVDENRRKFHQKKVNDFYSAKSGQEYNGCAVYSDFREVLARKDIDAVVIAAPDHWHGILAVAAANAGKDIYCEKPLSLNIAEGRAMVNAARKNNRIFQTGSMQRSSSEFHKACELVRNGRIGKIKQVLVDVGSSSKWCDLPEETMEPGLNWDMWLGPSPMRGYNSILSPRGVHQNFPDWRNYREYSGGMMTDWGAHHFDIAQWALGMDNSGPVEIIPPEDPKATKGLRYIYANGVEMIHAGGGGVTFIGENGTILVNRGVFKATPVEIEKEPLGDNPIKLYKSTNHYDDFVKAIRSRQKPICDVEIGCRSASVCHLGNLAYWNHRKLKWDPEKEQFIGDAEANTWLGRKNRTPWDKAI
jgi:predicted dehydrogenase